MSTTTPNFSLVKPQLTDTADITAMNPNWDTIDNELKSHDDTIASLNDIINNLDASTLGALSSTLPTITDANTSIADSNPTGIKIERWSKTTLNTPYTQGLTTRSDGVVITAVIKGTFATQLSFPIGGRGLYIRHNMVGSIYAWTEYGDFKADGSVPMTGTVLNMSNGEGSFENNGIDASIRVRKVANDDSNSTSLVLDNSFSTSPHRKLYLRDTVNGVNTDYKLYGEHNPPTDVCLPLDGGVTMSGDLKIKNDSARFCCDNGTVYWYTMETAGDIKNRRQLSLHNITSQSDVVNALVLYEFVNGALTKSGGYKVFGEHNKPSGSYTGNGSATERNIEIGGIGMAVLITSGHGFGIVSHNGGLFSNGAGTGGANSLHSYGGSYIKFAGGVLTIKSAEALFNNSGTSYNYQVL